MRMLCLICLALGMQVSARASCNTLPVLSTSVADFHVRQISRIEALLIFGEERNLCFGIEKVDTTLLTELSDFDIGKTTVEGAIRLILGSDHSVTIEQHFGIIEIIPVPRRAKSENIFDVVIPEWQAQRGNLQLVSWLLHIQLVQDLNPQIQGFGGKISARQDRSAIQRRCLDRTNSLERSGKFQPSGKPSCLDDTGISTKIELLSAPEWYSGRAQLRC